MTGDYLSVVHNKQESDVMRDAPKGDYCRITFHGSHRSDRIQDIFHQLGNANVLSIRSRGDEVICRRDRDGEGAALEGHKCGCELTTVPGR